MVVDNPDVFSSLDICTRGGFQADNWEQVLICHVLGSICYCCDLFFFFVFFWSLLSPPLSSVLFFHVASHRGIFQQPQLYQPIILPAWIHSERVSLKPSLAVGKIIIFILCLMRASFIDATIYLVKEFRLMTTTRCRHIIIYFDCCNVEDKVLLTINHFRVCSQ